MEGILVAVPERGGGAAGIAEGMHVKIAKLLGIANQIGKGRGGLRIIQVMPLPESRHDQVISDDERNDLAAPGIKIEAFENGDGQLDAALAVVLDPGGLADVMQEQDQVEQGGIGGLVEFLAVFEGDRLGLGEDPVELPDGVERVDVGGVAVIELMLHEAGEPVERGDEPAQHPQFVHQLQGGEDRSRLAARIARKLMLASGDALTCRVSSGSDSRIRAVRLKSGAALRVAGNGGIRGSGARDHPGRPRAWRPPAPGRAA